ncbi:uncharacterized protein K444DRAFT_696279 [Hyaloscypha bicolor E]|uniref:Uncharacterized protein n=1 Tax=Hyaloscypha bicolor E TaxID=1095630 RepID=A0A2J6SW38_9HELO|nr:uncharacterized protein K444DRAFT_696279 [Hyaloscypha bicolor E]PMD54981.1 hypothetical protein K444DRAFT_696279 [Hyaloscypha bicolor E]
MSWGYNSKVVTWRSFGSTASIQGHARGLLADVNNYRRTRQAEGQKLIFVAHDIGGILVQAALGESLMGTDNLYRYVAGIIFLGTPHRGSRKVEHAAIIVRILSGLGIGTRSPMLKQLKPNSDALLHISMQFRKLLRRAPIQICSAFETRRTSSSGLVRS